MAAFLKHPFIIFSLAHPTRGFPLTQSRRTHACDKNAEPVKPSLQILCACSQKLWQFFFLDSICVSWRWPKDPRHRFSLLPSSRTVRKQASTVLPAATHGSRLKCVRWVRRVRVAEQSLPASTPSCPLHWVSRAPGRLQVSPSQSDFLKTPSFLNFCGLILGPDPSGAKATALCWSRCGSSAGWYLLRSSPRVPFERCCLQFFTCYHRVSSMCCNSSCVR